MPAPDYAQEIGALETAMASGELTVEENGTRVTYQSFSDLRARLSYFRSRAAEFASPQMRGGHFVAQTVFER